MYLCRILIHNQPNREYFVNSSFMPRNKKGQINLRAIARGPTQLTYLAQEIYDSNVCIKHRNVCTLGWTRHFGFRRVE